MEARIEIVIDENKSVMFVDNNGDLVAPEFIFSLMSIGKLKIMPKCEEEEFPTSYLEFGNQFYLEKV